MLISHATTLMLPPAAAGSDHPVLDRRMISWRRFLQRDAVRDAVIETAHTVEVMDGSVAVAPPKTVTIDGVTYPVGVASVVDASLVDGSVPVVHCVHCTPSMLVASVRRDDRSVVERQKLLFRTKLQNLNKGSTVLTDEAIEEMVSNLEIAVAWRQTGTRDAYCSFKYNAASYRSIKQIVEQVVRDVGIVASRPDFLPHLPPPSANGVIGEQRIEELD